MIISKWWSSIWVGQFWCYVSVSSKYIYVKYRNIKSWSGAQIFLLWWVILYHHFVSEGISFYIHHRKYKFSWTIVTARKRSCGKVMFSQVSVHRRRVRYITCIMGQVTYPTLRVPSPQYHTPPTPDIRPRNLFKPVHLSPTPCYGHLVVITGPIPQQSWHLEVVTEADGMHPTGIVCNSEKSENPNVLQGDIYFQENPLETETCSKDIFTLALTKRRIKSWNVRPHFFVYILIYVPLLRRQQLFDIFKKYHLRWIYAGSPFCEQDFPGSPEVR